MKATHERARSLYSALMGARSAMDRDPGVKAAIRILETASALRAVAGLLDASEHAYRRRCFDAANKASYLAGLILDEAINDLVILRLREAQEGPMPNLDQLIEESAPKGSDIPVVISRRKKLPVKDVILKYLQSHQGWFTSREISDETGLTLSQAMMGLSYLRSKKLVEYKRLNDPDRGKHNAFLHAGK